jgi:hypothetical protein
MKKMTILLGLILLLCGCTTTYRISDYDLNKEYTTEVGAPMVVREECWGDNYQLAAALKDCILRQEIIYSGIEGNLVGITYKEYVGEKSVYSSKESFFQVVRFNLRQSDVISYRDIFMKVIEADKTFIRFMVIDRMTYTLFRVPEGY